MEQLTEEQLKAAQALADAREVWLREKTVQACDVYIAANQRFREVCTLKE